MTALSIPRIVVSGLSGGSGKTILSVSISALWRKKGIQVIPFKKGPDYIDAGWLALAAGGPCYNLDLFMMSSDQVVRSFLSHARGGEVAVIEGNRGLYDGMDSRGTCSTAELSKALAAPVIITVDCAKVTRTVAAMILGCQEMERSVPIRGVVLNNIASGRQERVIRDAVEKTCHIPVVGVIPRSADELLPVRHMGLTPFQEHGGFQNAVSTIEEMGRKSLDMDKIWEIAAEAKPVSPPIVQPREEASADKGQFVTASSPLRVGVVKDSAFQFYYRENIEELEKQGAEIVLVSALTDEELPDLDALYIGGGFPETNAIRLAGNDAFKMSLYHAVEEGLPVYAECGGLMYLGKSLLVGNNVYPMTGVFPLVFILDRKPKAHGYTIAEVTEQNPYFSTGVLLRGHEFHYSAIVEMEESLKTSMVLTMKRGKGIHNGMDGITYKNVFASYTHLHAIGSPEWGKGIMTAAGGFRKKRDASLSPSDRS
jgi:cobyrinic acid a,c-diamide synthase